MLTFSHLNCPKKAKSWQKAKKMIFVYIILAILVIAAVLYNGLVRSRNQVWFDKLQQKGYPLHLVDYKTDEELEELEFKKSVFDWMEAMGQSWEASVAKGQETWKGKFKKGVKDFFAV